MVIICNKKWFSSLYIRVNGNAERPRIRFGQPTSRWKSGHAHPMRERQSLSAIPGHPLSYCGIVHNLISDAIEYSRIASIHEWSRRTGSRDSTKGTFPQPFQSSGGMFQSCREELLMMPSATPRVGCFLPCK